MPELPEVEVLKRELEPLLVDKQFATPVLHIDQTVAYPSPPDFIAALYRKMITGLLRKGKYLVVQLSAGYLAVHLRMTGNLIYSDKEVNSNLPFLRVEMPFSDGSSLAFCDMRRFGRLWFVDNKDQLNEKVLKNVGPDLLTDLDADSFITMLGLRSNSSIKALLLNQAIISGLGNIYTDEALFKSGIHPGRKVKDIGESQARKLFTAIQEVLQGGIANGGTSFRDYRKSSGALGAFQHHLLVYGRKGEKCFRCGSPVQKKVHAGRGTHYCSCCQS